MPAANAGRAPGRHRRPSRGMPRVALPLVLVAAAAAVIATLSTADPALLRAALLGAVAVALILSLDRSRRSEQFRYILADTAARRSEVDALRAEAAALGAQVETLVIAGRETAEELARVLAMLQADTRKADLPAAQGLVIDLAVPHRAPAPALGRAPAAGVA